MLYSAKNFHPQKNRVVVTGAGVISPAGEDWHTNCQSLRTGKSHISKLTLFDAKNFQAKIAGQIKNQDSLDKINFDKKIKKRLDRSTKTLAVACQEALTNANAENIAADSFFACFGTSAGAMNIGQKYLENALANPGRRRGQASLAWLYQTQAQISLILRHFQKACPLTIVSNACSSGTDAIGQTFHRLRNAQKKDAQIAFAGGYDTLSRLVYAGFDSLRALSPNYPNPFAKNRDGLALGEGAAVFIIETLSNAERRGVTPIAEIKGYAATTDVHHLTQPQNDGEATYLSMNSACRDGNLHAADIDYINAHGTGTAYNDHAEAKAILRWANEGNTRDFAVSSSKGMIGHLLGGAGAVEFAFCLMAMQKKILPPMPALKEVDPVCEDLDIVREERTANIKNFLSNSIGFGGANSSIVAGEYLQT